MLETPETTLSRGMQWLNGQYAQKFNKRHKRGNQLANSVAYPRVRVR